ncbi:MAG TPA: TetR/AcrR family transcriptional regulator, partial [Vicinamibacterales bacterium]
MNIHSVPAATSPTADKRVAILDAATAVFAKRGFFNAQVADVARAAGIAAGTVYLYFRSKDEILTSIFDRTMKEAIDEGRDALKDVRDPVERLRQIARLHLTRLGSDRNLAIVFQIELRQTTKFMERFSKTGLRDYLAVIQQTIEEGQARGVFRKSLNARTASKVFFGALDELATNWILSRR